MPVTDYILPVVVISLNQGNNSENKFLLENMNTNRKITTKPLYHSEMQKFWQTIVQWVTMT